MPAQNLSRTNAEGMYCHVHNRGIEDKNIFNDSQDYQIFLGYLQDYLSAPADPEATKKTFSIRGRSFRGTPHQSKNYFNKVELVAYSLMPDHFHLLVYQKTRDSIEGLIRSLGTRYSMYFNKKYQRTGPLFQGPYKSVQITGDTLLLSLSRYLHIGGHSSYPDYLGARTNPWIKSAVVLSLFKSPKDYRDFVEKQEPSQKEKDDLSRVILENEDQHLERRNHASHHLKKSEILTIGGLFLLLLSLGIRNVMSASSPVPAPTPLVLSKATAEKPKTMLRVNTKGQSGSVNIRQEPNVDSIRIGQAKEADVFEFVSTEDTEWYEIKLANGSTGFISAQYIEINN